MKNNCTPLVQFSQHILLKREDLSPTGSHKFRYFEKKLPELSSQGVKTIVLSTTGNAGISAAMLAPKFGMKIIAVMSDRGDVSKGEQIEAAGGVLVLSPTPIKIARLLAKKLKASLLRMSTDDGGPHFYASLGKEILEHAPEAKAIVNFCSSGTSSLELSGVPVHLVQSGKSCSLVSSLHPEQIPSDFHQGVGLFDTPRKESLLNLVKRTGGDVWYASEAMIQEAQLELESAGIETSFEGAASFAVGKILSQKISPVVVILSGKKWPDAAPKNPIWIRNYEDVKRCVEEKSLI